MITFALDMKATELRIGNYFRYSDYESLRNELKGTYAKIIADDILYLDEVDGDLLITPIPLTEEVLVKCGFVNYIGTNNWRSEHWEELYFVGGILHFNVDGKTIAIVERVHELQNLIFALTHKELEINL